MTRAWALWAAGIAAALGVGVGSFLVVRTLAGDGSGVEAQLEPLWWASYFNDDAGKPRFDRVINGITVGPTANAPSPEACLEAKPRYTSPTRAAGTELEISPRYLPPGVQLRWSEAVDCGGTLVSVLKEYSVPSKLNPASIAVPIWSGGTFSIFRIRSTTMTFPLDGAAERMEGISIRGRPAVLMRPVMPAGFDVGLGNTAIIVAEPFGLTAIQGNGLPLGEFVSIAESLFGE